MTFDDLRQFVIRGVLDKIDEESGQGNKSTAIRDILEDIFQEDWNIITYSTFEEEKGYGVRFNWRGKLQVYGVLCQDPYDYDDKEIEKFIKEEFGSAKIQNIGAAQGTAERKMNEKFQRKWKVHIANVTSRSDSSISGANVRFDDIRIWIMKVSA
jgi:hypothetical protein